VALLRDTEGDWVPVAFADFGQQNAYFCGVVHGHADALSQRLAAVTFSDRFIAAHIDNGTESDPIYRASVLSDAVLFRAIQARMDAMEFWKESNRWGDDPFSGGGPRVHRE